MAAKTPKPVKGASVEVKLDRGAKRKRKGKGEGEGEGEDKFAGVSVAAHPRAGASVRRLKGFGGVAGFMLAAGLSLKAGVPTELAGERAIGGGIAGYLIAWGTSVTVWRQLVLAELRTASEVAEERHAALLAARRAHEIGTP